MTEMISLRDLQQIRDAVSELRARSPKSVPADRVKEKIRLIEACDPMLQFDLAHLRRHRPVMATRNVVSTSTDHTK